MKKNTKERIYYYLFDWANSPFSTVIITFVFSSYFVNVIAETSIKGTSQWGWMIAISGLCIALFGPILGIIGDTKTNFSKKFILFSTILVCFFSSLLWFSEPASNYLFYTLCIIFISNTLFELSQIFYNSQISKYNKEIKLGQFSGFAWAMGYLGGISCLLLILSLFIFPDNNFLHLEKKQYEHIRICGPIVAIWYLFFSLPFILSYKQPKKKQKSIKVINYKNIILKSFKHKNTLKFLLSRMLYTDGLITLFAFGGIYASGTFGFSFNDIIVFGIILNFTAAIGAYTLGFLEDKIGIKKSILLSLFFLISISFLILLIENKTLFWILGASLGFFIGSVQSSSRTALVKLSQKEDLNKMFGLYVVSGKITNFLGPFFVATLTTVFDSQRAGMASILFFLILGFLILRRVKI